MTQTKLLESLTIAFPSASQAGWLRAAALNLGFGAAPQEPFSFSRRRRRREKEEKRGFSGTPRASSAPGSASPGKGLAALCNPAFKRAFQNFGMCHELIV